MFIYKNNLTKSTSIPYGHGYLKLSTYFFITVVIYIVKKVEPYEFKM